MIRSIRRWLRVRRLRSDISHINKRVLALRNEANALQFDVLPGMIKELDRLVGRANTLKVLGQLTPSAYREGRLW